MIDDNTNYYLSDETAAENNERRIVTNITKNRLET
jgi:hypothetical protein